jgi:hypothetical protein
MGETRRAFGLYLTHVLKRISSSGNELAVQHAALVLRFLRRACASLRMPYNIKVTLHMIYLLLSKEGQNKIRERIGFLHYLLLSKEWQNKIRERMLKPEIKN